MTRKRWHSVTAKPGELKAAYGRQDDGSLDLLYAWGGDGAARADARMLGSMIEDKRKAYSFSDFPKLVEEPSLREELEARGYDITTLRITIQKKT